ncbi:endonuclease/exonuclease/phosphatase family protein [Streptomyces kasugaensis]|uniref:Endonuclease/exonuclease/phosphatase family protein n=1 Tax=Streptomyces kasugaensis TaxID=1946 RepID=A0A4Q9HQ77_STRKA|nr:endonuclease/exonuclease/phosphatase family protein [Streptomyces kasugaensis]TBO57078.1 endonuclease/exonuclease/phosphatase family protein [Streptomyces kasugaensis]
MYPRTRFCTYNLLLGGSDESRLRKQESLLTDISPDVLALQECALGDEAGHTRLRLMAERLGMAIVTMARSAGNEKNFTALLYRPSKFRVVTWRLRGIDVFHHSLIEALMRPVGASDSERDFLAFATHLSWADGESRLREARRLTDYGGKFPGTPGRAVLLMDSNVPDREPESWDLVPRNLWPRYRLVNDDGTFGPADERALRVLLGVGWTDPATLTGQGRAATVGYYYANETAEFRLDHILTAGDWDVRGYRTHDTEELRTLSDHLPVTLDIRL